MQRVLLLLFIGLICSQAISQELHREVIGDDGNPFLLGPIDTSLLKDGSYATWYSENYESYQPDIETVGELKKALGKYHVLIFLGTWCGDSRREVPRLIRILKEANFPEDQLKIVAVDRREPNVKKSPYGEEWGLQIKRVPTFILIKDGREINRIVESPIESLERDMLRIITHKEYEPNYAELMRSE